LSIRTIEGSTINPPYSKKMLGDHNGTLKGMFVPLFPTSYQKFWP